MFDSRERGTVLGLKSVATAKFVYATANVFFLHDCTNALFQVENYSGWDNVSGRGKSKGGRSLPTAKEKFPSEHRAV